MSRGLNIKYDLTFAPDFKEWPKRTIAKAMEVANDVVGKLWVKDFQEKHFTQAGGREYEYEKRSPKYLAFKGSRTGGRPQPLVGVDRESSDHKGGELRRQFLATSLIRASNKRVTVRKRVPAHAKFRGRSGTGPDMIEELFTISKEEVEIIGVLYPKVLAKVLESEPKKKRIRT